MAETSGTSAQTGQSAAQVGRLLASDPAAAEARAREILKQQPQSADALLMLAAALRRQRRATEARAILEPIVTSQPDSAFALLELGLTLGVAGDHVAALDALTRSVDLSPKFFDGWRALGDELALLAPPAVPVPADVEKDLQAADAAISQRRPADAETLLARSLEVRPDLQSARFRLAIVLLAQGKVHGALPVIAEMIRREPDNPYYRELNASVLGEIGEFQQAIAHYEALLKDGRQRPGAWMSYARALRTVGREEECTAAIWKATEILPSFAQAYCMLATVKTLRFAPEMIDRLRALLARSGLPSAARAQLHFALAKAYDDSARYEEAFANYARSQELQGTGTIGSGRKFRRFVEEIKAVFTPDFLQARSGGGCNDRGPIFVVGMPRSGSTLVQEILGAHSSIEALGELQDLGATVNGLRSRTDATSPFPRRLAAIEPDRFRAMGAEYLLRTKTWRKRGLPYFVDKLPQNFIYAGLLHLILPNARIVDVRRHPLDCCVSCFTNYFPEGPVWSHSLDDLGSFYAGYVELMAHFDEVLPGRIYRLAYEDLVDDPEESVRRVFAYLGLPFEEQCLRFYESEQAILTTSVEQARRPIYRGGKGASRKFDPWLGSLKSALGQVLDDYPASANIPPKPNSATP